MKYAHIRIFHRLLLKGMRIIIAAQFLMRIPWLVNFIERGIFSRLAFESGCCFYRTEMHRQYRYTKRNT